MKICSWEEHIRQPHLDIKCYLCRNMQYPLHTHSNYHELLIVDKGVFRHRLNGEEHLLREGEMLLIKENDNHELLGGDSEVFNLPFCAAWMKKINILFGDDDWSENFLAKKYTPQKIPNPEWPIISHDMHSILLSDSLKLQHTLISSILLRILAKYFASADHISPEFRTYPIWFKHLLIKLDKDKLFSLSVNELSILASCSPEHLARTFRRYLKISPIEYLTQKRINCARNLLCHTNIPIKQIAIKSGFSNESYFCRQFLKNQGVTPSNYRKQMTYLSNE